MYERYYYNPVDYNILNSSDSRDDGDPDWRKALKSLLCAVVWIAAIVLVVGMCSSCTTTRYVPVVQIRTDTVQITKLQRDSIYVQDSTHVSEKQKGDTLYIEKEKWHTKYIERETHDTIYQATHDTIPQPYPVPEYVEKKLSWWQRLRLHLGNIMLVLLGAAVLYGAVKIYLRLKPL